MQTESILIVGAGPTGLMAACQLARLGIPFRIIDKKSGPTKESRALGIQASTLEIFAQMGLVEKFLSAGTPTRAVNFWIGNNKRRIPLGNAGTGLTEYPYLFILEQSKTEQFLITDLATYNHAVEWETELFSLRQEENQVNVILQKQGKKESLAVPYLIGADGAHSVVRHSLEIPFIGAAYKQSFYLLDCVVGGLSAKNELYLSMSKNSFVGLFPLQAGRSRVIGTLPNDDGLKKELDKKQIITLLKQQLPFDVTINDPDWISYYHTHHRCARHFRVGRCFLAGDSAHIHSPAGAQGMNTGLQDAYNLAWKLAYVLQHKSPETLLDTYNNERLAFAKKLVHTTDRMFSFVVDERPLQVFLRLQLMPRALSLLLKTGYVKKFVFPMVSQIGITYREQVQYYLTSQGRFNPDVPRPGDRLPYIPFLSSAGKKQNLQVSVDGVKTNIFVFSRQIHSSFAQQIKTHVKDYPFMAVQHVLFTARTKKLYDAYGIEKEGFYIVRPDMYIAYRSNGYNKKHLQRYLDKSFIPSSSSSS